MPVASMKQLLEAGVHFGHQTRRWNPKMKPYIFTERGGIHIIDLQQTTVLLDRAYDFVRNVTGRRGVVLFVGTKKQCQGVIREEAERVGMPYVAHRWLGGLLTNFVTIENRIKRLHELRKLNQEGQLSLLPTKERMALERELQKLEINLGGVSNMTRLPDAVFVIDPKREAIATKEANKLGLPLIGLCDTNCDPDEVDYVIPGNDDAIRSCSLIVKTLARAVEDGKAKIEISEFVEAEGGEPAQAEYTPYSSAGDEEEVSRSRTARTPRGARSPAGQAQSRSQSRPGSSQAGGGHAAADGRGGPRTGSAGAYRAGPEGGASRPARARRPAKSRVAEEAASAGTEAVASIVDERPAQGAGADGPAKDQPGADQPGADQPAADLAAADRPAAGEGAVTASVAEAAAAEAGSGGGPANGEPEAEHGN